METTIGNSDSGEQLGHLGAELCLRDTVKSRPGLEDGTLGGELPSIVKPPAVQDLRSGGGDSPPQHVLERHLTLRVA